MALSFRRFAPLPPLLILVALAGCGAQSANKAQPTKTVASALTPATVATPAAASTLTVSGGSVAAVVNGHSIPMSTYRGILTFQQRQSAGTPGVSPQALAQQTMNDVIVDELVRQYASAHHITVTAAEVNAQIAHDQASLHGAQAFQQRLTQLGLSFAIYKELVTTSLLGHKVTQRVAPPNTKPQPVAHVRHILIMLHPQGKAARTDAQAHALAESLLHQIQHGANFATLAKKYSDDTSSAVHGGDLGNVYPHQTVATFDHAAFTLPPHHPALIHSVYGYHIVEVLSRGKAPLSASAQQQAQQQAFGAWLQVQMRHASIRRLAKVKS